MNKKSSNGICEDSALQALSRRAEIEKQIAAAQNEQSALCEELKGSFLAKITPTDVIVAVIAGLFCGGVNGLFKTTIPKNGKFKHKHSTTRTAVDYKVPKPEGASGNIQGLHRQIGPGHDIARFREALDLMSGKTDNFPLWGKTIAERTGGVLHPGNMKIADFLASGGFTIPADPKAELINHLMIDFFTKTSLPLPFTSYLADYSEPLAKIMLQMYDNGLNLKNAVFNGVSTALLQLFVHSYAFLFKSAKAINFYQRLTHLESASACKALLADLSAENKRYLQSKEFDLLQIIAHGASFLIDTAITAASNNYAGLFSLNYASLLVFATHVVKYVKKSLQERKDIIAKQESNAQNLIALNEAWYEAFREDMQEMAEKDGFFETFDPEAITRCHEEAVARLAAGKEKRASIRNELQDWKIDDDE